MKTLRTRLTALYTATTGAILLFVTAVFLVFSVRNTRQAQVEHFQVIWASVSSRFLASGALSHSFLAQTEADYRMVIHIRENGIPFRYPGSWQPRTSRDTLIMSARNQAEAEGVFMDQAPVSSAVVSSSLMTVQGEDDDQYYAMVLSTSAKGGVKSLCVLAYIPPIRETLGKTIGILCLLALSGLSGLWFISWNFVGWSLKPVEESRQKQARFIAAASHELRSPLAVLRSAAARLSEAFDEKDTLLPLIDSECVRMSRLVEDMLFLASADAKTWSLHLTEVDMDTLLIDLFESFLPLCRDKNITLKLELSDEVLPRIQGDPQRLRQLLLILLDNAADHTPPGSYIRLCAFVGLGQAGHKNTLILQVEDQGCGIPDTSKPYIFDRFYQADSARSEKQHFGLGLSIAKELVNLHGGSISVADGRQKGSCFSVVLPVAPTQKAPES
ncbi:MAG: HAMP domain-containing histidine kinase [Hungatella sp.]|nr:HAMP domain-containing histidine kinase [Hungatella sp.]